MKKIEVLIKKTTYMFENDYKKEKTRLSKLENKLNMLKTQKLQNEDVITKYKSIINNEITNSKIKTNKTKKAVISTITLLIFILFLFKIQMYKQIGIIPLYQHLIFYITIIIIGVTNFKMSNKRKNNIVKNNFHTNGRKKEDIQRSIKTYENDNELLQDRINNIEDKIKESTSNLTSLLIVINNLQNEIEQRLSNHQINQLKEKTIIKK